MNNLFYIGAMEGIDQKMNMEFEKYLADPYTREAMIAEALVQNIAGGAYVDLSDVQRSFQVGYAFIENTTGGKSC